MLNKLEFINAINMKLGAALIRLALLGLLLLSMQSYTAKAQSVVEYRIYINDDGSAAWNIMQALDANASVDTWQGFQQRLNDLADAATIQTKRNMSLDPSSFQMILQEASLEYEFTWLNFSDVQTGSIIVGDVFHLDGFFNRLYGNGIVQITYPPGFFVQMVMPTPNQRDDGQQSLKWLSTQNFEGSDPQLILTVLSSPAPSPTPQNPTENSIPLSVVVSVGVAVIFGAALGFYFLKRSKRQRTVSQPPPFVSETEEEKVLKVVRSNGGSVYQSAVTEQCRFSKAKTSQLLGALEKKGLVRRYKRGRDKIVTLTEQGKGEHP